MILNIGKRGERKILHDNYDENSTLAETIAKYQIVILLECYIRNHKIDAIENHIPRHKLHTFNHKSEDRGIAVLVHHDLLPHILSIGLTTELIESVRIKVKQQDRPLIIYGVYMPHNQPYDHFDELQKDIERHRAFSDIIVAGDMNARIDRQDTIDMDILSNEEREIVIPDRILTIESKMTTNSFGTRLLEVCRESGLTILNGRKQNTNKPTRRNNHSSTVIDYALVNPRIFEDIEMDIHDKSEVSDHSAIDLHLAIKTQPRRTQKRNKHKKKHLMWSTETITKYENRVKERIQNLSEETHTAESITNMVKEVQEEILQEQNCTREPIPGIYSQETKNAFMQWREARRVEKLDPNTGNKAETRRTRNHYTALKRSDIFAFHCQEAKRLIKLSKTNPKALWKEFNDEAPKEKIEVSSDAMKDHIRKLYKNEQKDEDLEAVNQKVEALEESTVHELNQSITLEELQDVMKDYLVNDKASGDDGIGNEAWKYGGDELEQLVLQLFNDILEGKKPYPEEWKRGKIVALHKKGDKNDPNNYRTITLNRTLSKLYSAVLCRRISGWLESENEIGDEQYGFRKNRSTIDAVFVLLNAIRDAHHKKRKLVQIFIDFEKAFDRVRLSKLVDALIAARLPKQIIRIIVDMYTNLQAFLTIDKDKEDIDIEKGVKQGDPLSPLLFIVCLIGMKKHLQNSSFAGYSLSDSLKLLMLLYADDTVLIANSIDEAEKTIQSVLAYCQEIDMKINFKKTEAMLTGFKGPKPEWIHIPGSESIKVVNSFRYLGVTIKADGSLRDHIESKRREGWHKYRKWSFKIDNMKGITPSLAFQLFNAYVLPVLTHGLELLDAKDKDNHLQGLDKIQKKAMRKILCVPKRCALAFMYNELHTKPIIYRVYEQQRRYYRKLEKTKPETLLRQSWCHDKTLEKSWSASVESIARERDDEFWKERLSEEIELRSTLDFYATISSEDKSLPFYLRSPDIRKQDRIQFALFKSSTTLLYNNIARFKIYHSNARDQKLRCKCPTCHEQTAETETHIVLDCRTYETIRQEQLRGLPPASRNTILNKRVSIENRLGCLFKQVDENQGTVVRMINRIMQHRNTLITGMPSFGELDEIHDIGIF